MKQPSRFPMRRSRPQKHWRRRWGSRGADALAEYIARHDPESVTRAMDEVCDEVGQGIDPFTQAVGRRILERTEW